MESLFYGSIANYTYEYWYSYASQFFGPFFNKYDRSCLAVDVSRCDRPDHVQRQMGHFQQTPTNKHSHATVGSNANNLKYLYNSIKMKSNRYSVWLKTYIISKNIKKKNNVWYCCLYFTFVMLGDCL